MQAEAIQPIIKELPTSEKRKLLAWLELQVDAPIKTVNKELQRVLIKHITK